METVKKYKILIVDDSEMNRTILTDILEEKFEIMEAEDGLEAIRIIKQHKNELSLMLLDLVMPNFDGLDVLAMMNRYDWIDDIPVIMISSETAPAYIERAYELGVTDFISRPFNVFVVRKRVANTIMLYEKQRRLVNLVNQQTYERIKTNDLMINILSHIVEFRNGESGLHILHVNTITEVLLRHLIRKTDKYKLSNEDIETIVIASSLHDIGKISISENILNKPDRLTPEEYEIMKTHTTAGADMLGALTDYEYEPLVKFARDICNYHHERYDGSGYPYGLAGDEIPIAAQVVSIADVYDALTSVRCYKDALSHKKAIEMIKTGECGVFNPILLECFEEIEEMLERNMKIKSPTRKNMLQIKARTEEMLRQNQFSIANNSINYLEQERIKNEFYASLSKEIQYEYTTNPSMLTISEWSANKFALPQIIINPLENEQLLALFQSPADIEMFAREMNKTSVENPITQFEITLRVGKELRHHRVYCRVNWSTEERVIISSIGKIIDIEEEFRTIKALEKDASTDNLTSIYNRGYAEKLIKRILASSDEGHRAVLLFDVDDFKTANDTYGHLFGDTVLKKIASALNSLKGEGDVVARIGGDEFMMFIGFDSYDDLEARINQAYDALGGIDCGDFDVCLSMGVATTDKQGRDYLSLFYCADAALYYSKRNGKGNYSFYEEGMELTNEGITPIEN